MRLEGLTRPLCPVKEERERVFGSSCWIQQPGGLSLRSAQPQQHLDQALQLLLPPSSISHPGHPAGVLSTSKAQLGLLTFEAVWKAMPATISARFFLACEGATFVADQFWFSLMFVPHAIGAVTTAAAGWGNLGHDVMQSFIISVLFRARLSLASHPGGYVVVLRRLPQQAPLVSCEATVNSERGVRAASIHGK